MSGSSEELVDMLRKLLAIERYLHQVSTALLGGQPETARAAYTAHDAVDALIEQLEIDAGATREVVRSWLVDDIAQALEGAVRAVVPIGSPVDRHALRLASRAQLRRLRGLPVDARAAAAPSPIQVPQVGPDGSIMPPAEDPRALE